MIKFKGYQQIGVNKNILYLYKKGVIYGYDLKLDKLYYILSISSSLKETILGKFKLVYRLLRLGIRASLIQNNLLFVYFDGKIYEIDLECVRILNTTSFSHSRPLYFTLINGVKGFDDMVVFGEYLSNDNKFPVSIYRRTRLEVWTKIYTFGKNEINHIHNIIPDKYNDCVWILTGDFKNASAIWTAKKNFSEVKPVLRGRQKFRSCIAFPTKDGLLYATDSPFEKNSIRLLYKTSSGYTTRKVIDIKGACIYGCKKDGAYYFSTTVEPNSLNRSLLKKLIDRKKGDGIFDYYSYIYKGTIESGFCEVYKAEKDKMPFTLFQYGALKFPQVEFSYPYLPVYHVATRKNDLETILLDV